MNQVAAFVCVFFPLHHFPNQGERIPNRTTSRSLTHLIQRPIDNLLPQLMRHFKVLFGPNTLQLTDPALKLLKRSLERSPDQSFIKT